MLTTTSLLGKGYKHHINRLFAVFSVVAAIWIVASDSSNSTGVSTNVALWAGYIGYSFGFASAILLLNFIVELVDNHTYKVLVKRSLLPLWVTSVIGATPLVVAGVVIQGDLYATVWGPLTWLYALGLLYIFGLIAYGIINGWRNSRGTRKEQLAYIGIGLLISIPPVLLFSLFIPLFSGMFWIMRFSATPTIFLVISLYYGVIRYHLLDVRAAAVRTLAYALSLVVMVVIYYFLAVFISNFIFNSDSAIDRNPIDIGLSLGLIFIFQPIKAFFDRLTNSIFYHDYYNSDEFFTRLNRLFTSTTNLRSLLGRIADEISITIKSEQAFFFINTDDSHYIVAGTAHHRQLSEEDALRIQTVLGKRDEVVIAALLDEDNPIRHLMDSHRIELILPLTQTKAIGYLCLGDHRTSHYTKRDIKVLNAISNGLIVAIQNTLSIQEIKDINDANLQQKILNATEDLSKSNDLLRQLDEDKNDFISVASHELRTPMTVIRGYISLLARGQLGPVNDVQRDVLNKVSVNAKTLIDLVNDMLDLSKLESDKLQMQLSDNSLDALIKNSLDQIRILFDSKGVNLSYSGVSAVVKTDTEKFERILLNLLSNAYKFTEPGNGVTVTSKIDGDGSLATICVADAGIGIPAESISHLFKKFSQVNNYLQNKTVGTGLGLAISKQLVEKLGGTIWVKSQPGVGSQFYFTVPISDKNLQ
jgi:signal transduction histidine kinase